MFSVFLSSSRKTRESLGELEKSCGNTRLRLLFYSISRSPELPLVFLELLDRNTVHVSYFLNKNQVTSVGFQSRILRDM